MSANFNIIIDNSDNKYGTASIVRYDIEYANIRLTLQED